MFNEKVMCLFKKDHAQVKKEAVRRGISTAHYHRGNKNTQELIAEIIYKDAYDAGKNDAMQNCPLKQPQAAQGTYDAYCLYDVREDRKYRLELTEEQVRVFHWLQVMEWLPDVELSEWADSFEDVGRI